jgi:hypothetical protein
LRASTPDRISGTIDISVALAGEAAAEPQALVELLSTWIRAVEIGFFGPGRIRLQGAIDTQGRTVAGSIDCADLSATAVLALSRMIQRFSKVKGRIENVNFFHEGRHLAVRPEVTVPALSGSIPFEVEYPVDPRGDVRVEIEFLAPLAESERDAIFAALAVWDVLVEALGEEEHWGEEIDSDSRRLSPRIVEHATDGYFASFDCLYSVVWMGLRLHRRLPIERLTIE